MHRGLTKCLASLTMLAGMLATQPAQAGPLLDWLFGHRRNQPAYPVGTPVPVGNGYAAGFGAYPGYVAGYPGYTAGHGSAPALGTYYSSNLPIIGPQGAGYPAGTPSGIVAATAPSAMIPSGTYSSVPNFNTYANRAPVTYYRPLMTTDPTTGAQVVTMAPCTSYEYQTQRVPALGRSTLFNGYPSIPTPPPAAMPTFTLPSGGIPLAGVVPGSPTVRGFGAYPTVGPATGLGMSGPVVSGYGVAGSFPTAPLGTTTHYGSAYPQAAGACGVPSIAAPGMGVPGMGVPGMGVPGMAVPSGVYPGGTVPGLVAPQTPQPVYPGAVTPSFNQPMGMPPISTDPAANVPPTLPPAFPTTSRREDPAPRLQRMTVQPQVSERPGSRLRPYSSSSESRDATDSRRGSEEDLRGSTLAPIPVPEGFEPSPRWNPGLLRDEDMTASHRRSTVEMAGMSTRIQWASFEQPAGAGARSTQGTSQAESDWDATNSDRLELAPSGRQLRKPNAIGLHHSGETPIRSETVRNETYLQPLQQESSNWGTEGRGNHARQQLGSSAAAVSGQNVDSARGVESNGRYDTRGWQSAPRGR
jgi:hypothetical protein